MNIKNYPKKLMVTAVTLLSLSLPSILHAQDIEPCNALFICEIIKDNAIDSSGTPYSNYIIEVFNPRSTAVNGNNYELQFTDANAQVTTIPLRGSIAAKSTYAISHTNAENNVLALMDEDTTALDFSVYTQVKLVHTSSQTVLDAFGEPLPQSFITFNYLLFMQDPDSYLSQYDLTLADLDHIGLRRSYFVDKGTPVFVATDVVGSWAFYTGTDHSDLRKHLCVCNPKPDAVPIIGYLYPSKTINEKLSLGNNTDNLDLIVSGGSSSTPIYITQSMIGGNATYNVHVRYNGSGSNTTGCNYTPGGSAVNCDYARTLNNLFAGTKNTNSVLQQSNFYDIDAAKGSHAIIINGNSTTGLKEHDYYVLPITIYPSVTNDILHVRGNIDCNYSITSVEGREIKEGTLYNTEIIDVTTLANGLYIITFYNYSGTKTDKFIKQ